MSQPAEPAVPPDALRNAIVRVTRPRACAAALRSCALRASARALTLRPRVACRAAARVAVAQVKTATFVAANGQVFEQRCVAAGLHESATP
jgi:hypothetical protein